MTVGSHRAPRDGHGRLGALAAGVATVLSVLLLAAAVVQPVAGVIAAPAPPARPRHAGPPPIPTPAPAPEPTPSPSPACPVVDGWDCAWPSRFDAVAARIAAAPGQPALVLLDRVTGARHEAGPVGRRRWTGSTSKLALAVYALEEARAGRHRMTDATADDLAAMLHVSDDNAADRVWAAYGGTALTEQFRSRYAMTGLTMAGSNNNWGALACGPGDLVALMAYALDRLHPDDRAWLVAAMRDVGDIQHWGVWSAGPAQHPGVKNGWLEDPFDGRPHWAVATVGFAGPDERYVLAVMYPMPDGQNSLRLGAQTLSDLAAVLFDQATPAPAVIRPS